MAFFKKLLGGDPLKPIEKIVDRVEALEPSIQKLSDEERAVTYDRLLSYKVPALLISRSIPADAQCLEMAKKHNVTLLSSHETTSSVVSA
ncbi:MAG: hypothetical protein IJP03_05725, partial [Christensenellaceae bacterium]|nr:hypothetical protein [Christensenellaceae bacterium]